MIFGELHRVRRNSSIDKHNSFTYSKKFAAKNDVTNSIESAVDTVHEYNIVKQMLTNNSLPVSSGNKELYSRKLIVDKKIMLNLLVDLQRFRKLLNLKKSFYIFHLNYDGKPAEMKKWHDKVEVRVTQTFRQLNIRRVIDIIGYDPSAYFKGEMSLQNMEQLKKGDMPASYQTNRPKENVSAHGSTMPKKVNNVE